MHMQKKKKNPQYFELLCTVIRTRLPDDSLIVARARTVQVVIDLEFFLNDLSTQCAETLSNYEMEN